MVGVAVGAESQPGVKGAVQVQVQVILPDELLQIGRAQEVFLLPKGVVKVEMIQTELVGHDDIPVVGDPGGDPVVAADGLHPPDFVLVGKGDAVGLIGTVLLQEHTQPLHTLPGAADIGEHDADQVFLADAAGNVLAPGGLFGLEADHGVGGQHPGICGDGLRGGHRHVGGVDAVGGPDSPGQVHAGCGGIAQGVIRQSNLQVADGALVFPGLILGKHHSELLFVKKSVIVSGNHSGAVAACFFAHQNGCTCHMLRSFLFRVLTRTDLPAAGKSGAQRIGP